MKGKPSTFKLAHLASLIPLPIRPKDAVKRAWEIWKESQSEIDNHEKRAEFLRSLFWTPNGKNIPIFTDSPEDWAARIKAYPGHQRDVERAMWEERFENKEVQKQLFKDKTLSNDLRRKLFLGLARASIIHDVEGPPVAYAGKLEYLGSEFCEYTELREGFPIHPKNMELAEKNYRVRNKGYGKIEIPLKEVLFMEKAVALLSAPKLYGYVVRWAVEVRQKQLAISKTRVIPPGVQKKFEDDEHDEGIQVKRKHTQ